MFCEKCGKEIQEGSGECMFCGNKINETPAILTNEEKKPPTDGLASAGIALGIIGIVMAWLLAIMGYLFGGAAIALSLVAKGKNPESKKAKTGIIISVVALVCSIISSVIGVIGVLSLM